MRYHLMDIGLCALMTGIEIDYHIGMGRISRDNLTLKVGTDSTLIAATVNIDYERDYAEDSWTRYVDERPLRRGVSQVGKLLPS